MLFHLEKFQVPVVLKDNRRGQRSRLFDKIEVRGPEAESSICMPEYIGVVFASA
jgi:hypothetical protein